MCIESPLKEGQFYCDCDESDNKVYTGLSCQHEATVFCTETGDFSKVGFCANGGTCLGMVDENQPDHLGCTCPTGYDGQVRTVALESEKISQR